MKKLEKIIVTVLILIIIITAFIIILKNKHETVYTEEEIEQLDKGNQVSEKESITLVNNPTMYYTVESCVQKYLTYFSLDINKENPVITDTGEELYSSYQYALSIGATTKEKKNEIVYDILDPDYVNKNNITLDNIETYIGSTNVPLTFTAKKMAVVEGKNVFSYAVFGTIEEANTRRIVKDAYYIVVLDRFNMTYSIEPLEDNYKNIDEIKLEKKGDKIEPKAYNSFTYTRVNETMLLTKYLGHYKNNAIKNPEEEYEYLDTEYREKKFGNLEGFKKYVNENQSFISGIILDKYQKTEKEGYVQYVCLDTKGNYYIFKETATMQYKLMLDTYTIDIPEFTQKYNSADNETKVGMNIEKITAALNIKDYNYIYSKLADGFKNNYFPTVDSLEQYLKNNLFERNTVEYNSVDNEGKNYMFDIKFNDNTGNDSGVISKRIIMQLKEGTDFVFSFDV